ncbi:MAG: metallophosphatase family protein [Desulfobacterales bacterium]|nr:metallophosphatase family protein [Desulfobacterales bacterium]
MKIGLISDLHATAGPVREALAVFQRQGVDRVLCGGDIAGYGTELEQTVDLLIGSGCETIPGNHDLWYLNRPADRKSARVVTFFEKLPLWLEVTLKGKRVYLVHASPPQSLMEGITLLDEHAQLLTSRKERWTDELEGSEFDVLVVGHTHQVFAEQLGNVLVINPGSTKFNHTCAILSLPEMEFQIFALSNKTPVLAWNWGMIRRSG